LENPINHSRVAKITPSLKIGNFPLDVAVTTLSEK